MKRSFAIMSVLVLLTGLFAGCSNNNTSQPQSSPSASQTDQANAKPQILRMNAAEPETLDSGMSNDVISGAFIRSLYDSLVRLDKDGKPVNSVASDIKISDDKKVYTFTLRDSKWSNGDPVTAKDFAFAWMRVLDPKTASGSAYKYYPIKNARAFFQGNAKAEDVGIKVIDDKTLEVTLENPTPYFLTLATFYYPVNQKVVEGNADWAKKPESIVTNGPFKLSVWEHKNKIELVKNDQYWEKDVVKLDKIDFSMIEDTNTELEMFNNDDLDWAGAPISGLPADAIGPLHEEGKLQTMERATNYYLLFQTEKAPFTNEKIRKAFSYAINRKDIADNIGQAGQTPLMGFVPLSASLKKEGYFKDNDTQTAKQLLADGIKELGLAKLPEITYLYNTSDLNKKIAEALQAQWKQVLGVDVKLVNKELKVMFDDQEQGNYMISRSGWTGDYNDSVNFLELLMEKNSSNNSTLWHSEKYVELVQKAYAEPDESKRNEYLVEAEGILMDEMPVTGIYSSVNSWVQSEKVKGITVDPLGYIDFKWGYKES
ncbi:peptide ABC transporter substrate-binding protein [Brevibacillus centrosporus]|uniref:peptide ABC transporter substrate-binding protein n=1 Tax=Brevibacillus centrosporus TaxID=54910 RepID=UPI000F0A90AB|nr:peptide ABC transporter substrate-binding protein [Brevibacillus centrosporus]MEC2132136.1 peptide ABC transporter substrate-binding protein [Brevibacillus centrosporus]RNB68722.1 peptide ABC transporter substrate-binding protein [Brevibacillus centrosporus]GED31670.1 oligopeptide-binding protein OppA [Brevibacillus centrosporus]